MIYPSKSRSVLTILVFLVIFSISDTSFAFKTSIGAQESLETQEIIRGGRPSGPRGLTAQPQNEGTDAASLIKNAYAKIAETLNNHSQPTKDQIASNEKVLRVPRAALNQLDKITRTQYYMLKAWNDYFSNNIRDAQFAAALALRTSPDIEDTRITVASITLLANEKPVKVPLKRSLQKDKTNSGYDSPSQQDMNLLDLDVDGLYTDLLNPKAPEKITAMNLNCMNSTIFKYTPGKEVLCAIFWRLPKNASSEPNDPASTMTRPATAPQVTPPHHDGFENEYGMPQNPNTYGNKAAKQNSGFLSNINAFKEMFAGGFDMEVKFLAVNTDNSAVKENVIEKIMDNPWPWANVIAHDPKSGDKQFQQVSVEHEKPLLVITSNDGTIKYAGPAAGFLAPLVFSEAIGKEISPTASSANQYEEKSEVSKPLTGLFGKSKSPSGEPDSKKTDTQASPNTEELDFIEKAKAERLLEGARKYIKMGRRVITPKKGIQMCREILKEYPNTKYSEEARMLLREVPERYRRQYKITNEELGL